MKLLKHRCNSLSDIMDAKKLGFDGIELDVVWRAGLLWVNHDPRDLGGFPLYLALNTACIANGLAVAINVKEYGMAQELAKLVGDYSTLEYFIFDIPGPELHAYHSENLRICYRISEYESPGDVADHEGILVDSFDNSERFVNMILHQVRDVFTAVIGASVRGAPERVPVPQPTYLICKEKPCNHSSLISTEYS